jgi:hypothetical protein
MRPTDTRLDEGRAAERGGHEHVRDDGQHQPGHRSARSPAVDQERGDGNSAEDRESRAEDARAEVADQEHVGGDVAGVGVEIVDGGLVGQSAHAEQDAVERKRPQADPRGVSGNRPGLRDGAGSHDVRLLRGR